MPAFSDTSDVLNLSTALRRASVKRMAFDPTDPAHCASLACFIQTGNWGDVQFYCEHPFTDVPMTVLMKYAGHQLGVSRLTSAEIANLRAVEAA
jgi:hypothetical protein